MSEKRHFHPLAILVSLVKSVRSSFYIFILILFQTKYSWGTWLALGGFLLLLVGLALVRYWFSYYEISAEQVVIYKGIIRKKETLLPYERMQTIKERQWFFFRPFRVTQILIETAGGSGNEAEASMPAVPQSVLETIERYRRREPTEQVETQAPDSEVRETDAGVNQKNRHKEEVSYIYQVSNRQIFLFGLTDLSILAALFALVAFVQELIPEERVQEAVDFSTTLIQAGWLIIAALVILGLVLMVAVSLIRNFLQYYHFQVSRDGATLTIESGLLERKVQKIPLEKIQGIRINQQILRKFLGLSSVELLLAGGQESSGESGSSKLYFLPIVSDKLLYEALAFLLPEWQFEKPTLHYCGRGRLWYFSRWFLLLLIPCVGSFFFSAWIGGALALAIVLVLIGRWLDSQYQGYQIQSNHRLCIQGYLLLTRQLTYVEKNKLQAFSVNSSLWLAKKGIGSVELAIKEGSGSELLHLRYLEAAVIQELQEFFRGRSEQ